ncbi:MAG TPA: cytochrome c [Chitinophagaceae bacterium]|nr:cytochrome c [Chitinophagaceae bacterium]
MKKLSIISIVAVTGIALFSCNGVRRDPGRAYMPDMAYSRAYETYAMTEEHRAELLKQGIHFSNTPVPGTVKRGANYAFRLPRDKQGDSTNYVASKQIQNPIAALDTSAWNESERLYLIHCGICHGAALDGNGPLWKGGDGPYPAAPRNLISDPVTANMPDGQMYYSVTYGKGAMGSYASQINPTQRWMIIKYIKAKQLEAKGGSAASVVVAPDTTGAGGAQKADSITVRQ